MTTAREIADKLNRYEATHSPSYRDTWNDVIRVQPEYDEEATAKADPECRGGIVVLTDGTRVDRREGRWGVVSTELGRVRAARWARERAEAALHERIREAAEAGVSERRIAEASGISRMTVRRIIGRA